MPKTVLIRVEKETREKLHAIKNPGQTLNGILIQMIALWNARQRKKKERNQF
jgi:hypothetical protein